MKNIFISLLVLVLPITGFSQASISVKEISLKMSKGMHNGFETEIPQVGVKDVEHDWKRRLTVGSKAKLTETNGEIAVHGIYNPDISTRPFNLYSILSSTSGGVKLDVWFTYNDTVFFAAKSGNSDAKAVSGFVRDFAAAEYYLAVKNMYEKERDKLDKLKDDLEKSIRLQEKSNLKITENQRGVTRAKDDLVTNDNDQKDATAAITLQQAELNKARSGNAEMYKAAEQALQTLQSAEKKLQSRSEELHKKIDEWNKEITTEDRNIATEKQNQSKTNDAIQKQKALINELYGKMKAIK